MKDSTIETFAVPRVGEVSAEQGVFRLWIDEPYRRGLGGLSSFSHVIVTWWAHEVPDQDPTEMVVAHETPYIIGPQSVGVFSTRSPARPSRLCVSTCAVTAVDEASGVVDLGWIDASNETPVVDIKPYFPSSDRVRDVEMPEWCAAWPACLEDSAEFAWESVMSK